MIIEFYGLPGSGKSTLATTLEQDSDFHIVKIKNRQELICYNILYFLYHPINFIITFAYVVGNSCNLSMFYYKFMNTFLHHNGTYQKALTYKNAIIDQGHYQNIISVFENPLHVDKLKQYIKFLPHPDILIIFQANSIIREARTKKRGYFSREMYGEDYMKKWQENIQINDRLFCKLLPRTIINHIFLSANTSKEEMFHAISQDIKKGGVSMSYIVNARMPTEKAYGYQISKMCEEFSKLNMRVTLYAPYRANDLPKSMFSFYCIQKSFVFVKIQSLDLFQFKKYIGNRLAFYFQSLFYFIHFLFIKIKKTEIIYSRSPMITWLFVLRGYKAVYECHDWFGKNKKISLFLLRKCKYIITTNSFIKKEFLKNRFKDQNILIASNGVNLHIFDIVITKQNALMQLSIPKKVKLKIENKKILLYTGNFTTMEQDKGLSDILRAMQILQDSDILFFAVGGSAKDISLYQKKARDMGVEDSVYFIGNKSQKELALFQKISDILLMPFPRKAQYEYFMTPLKMFEYMASNTPIIASNLPSIKEILNQENAILIDPENPIQLSGAIKNILHNYNMVKNLANHAHSDVQKHSWQQRAKNILNFIQ